MRPTLHVSVLGLLLWTALWAGPADARIERRPFANGPVLRCASPEPTRAEAAQCRIAVRAIARSRPLPDPARIRVAVHVLTCGRVGAVSDDAIAAQIDECNRAYAATGFQFVLDRIERVDDCDRNRMLPGSSAEREVKERLAVDPEHCLNLYVAAPGLVLGWSYFPQTYAENDPLHGVVVHYSTLPGGDAPYGRGRTAVHEIGHYLGLFHTFQNGCIGDGDGVEDTPAEASAALGCPEARNTCDGPGDDPIHNYMDYSDDACMREFTPGQIERMTAVASQFRGGLFGDLDRPLARANAGDPSARSNERGRSLREVRGLDRFDSHVLRETDGVSRLGFDANPRSSDGSRHGPIEHRRSAAAQRMGLARPEVRFDGAIPNPACHVNVMRFALPRDAHVKLVLRDEVGHGVRTIVSGWFLSGEHEVPWDPQGLRAGVYSAELRVGGAVHVRTVVIEREI